MKKIFITYFLIIIYLVAVPARLISQDQANGFSVEKVMIFTDRSLYIAGEKIFFSAAILNENNVPGNEYSRVFYIELITPDGNRIAAGKYPAENSSGQGCLLIPEETISGIYYLKSYTRLMRNSGPENYSYIRLKIINPIKVEVLKGNGVDDTSGFPARLMDEKQAGLPFSISTDKKIYATREIIKLKLKSNTGAAAIPVKLCLTVVPELAYEETGLKGKIARNPSGELQVFQESRGISLSGKLLENKTGRPVPNTLVNLSITGDKDAMAIRTDSSGRFFFALPGYTGNRDIFICAEDLSESLPVIYIENDFCPLPVNLPSPVFYLTQKENETALTLAVNNKITSIFAPDTASAQPGPEQNGKPFYGEPSETLVMEAFIDLPTIEDYFNEIVGNVKVRKSQGKKHFRFSTTRPEMAIYDPLVLIDWVAVNDINKILALSPKAIDRIELVNSPYVKGNITYGGIISIVSKNSDYAGIDLPASGTFVMYKFLEDCSGRFPADPIPDNVPDSRNTIYWDPDVQTDETGSADIFFTAPDTPGKYLILLRGMNRKGEIISIREDLEVIMKK
jgi:hypothetical protein